MCLRWLEEQELVVVCRRKGVVGNVLHPPIIVHKLRQGGGALWQGAAGKGATQHGLDLAGAASIVVEQAAEALEPRRRVDAPPSGLGEGFLEYPVPHHPLGHSSTQHGWVWRGACCCRSSSSAPLKVLELGVLGLGELRLGKPRGKRIRGLRSLSDRQSCCKGQSDAADASPNGVESEAPVDPLHIEPQFVPQTNRQSASGATRTLSAHPVHLHTELIPPHPSPCAVCVRLKWISRASPSRSPVTPQPGASLAAARWRRQREGGDQISTPSLCLLAWACPSNRR